MKTYAYARVSARDQNLVRQIEAFQTFGVDKKNIYSDKKSGKDFERKNYLRLLRKLKKGDLLVIKSIDRLGRNYKMITEEWRRIQSVLLEAAEDMRHIADILENDKQLYGRTSLLPDQESTKILTTQVSESALGEKDSAGKSSAE